MAEDNDDSQKTEDASSRKLDEARKKGQVPQSREVTNWFVISGSALSMLIFAPGIAGALQHTMARFIGGAPEMRLDSTGVAAILDSLGDVGLAVLPLLGLMMVAGIAGVVLQTGLIFAPDKLAPKLEHLSPLQGMRRIFSLRAVIEFLKGLAKITVVGAVATYLLMPEIDRLPLLPSLGTIMTVDELRWLSFRLAAVVIAMLTIIAITDFTYQKLSFLKSMRMSKQEVKEEYKQVEGNPFIKSKLRQIRTERARKRMMAAVPTASVVVTNPTHYAVALHYEMNAEGAPRVVAKGADLIAAKIREIAKKHDVPIVENPPVARTLYATVEIDQEIPPEQYKAVAEIIGYVLRLKGKLKPK
jgi:flagellar biosynthetic protein FlhB